MKRGRASRWTQVPQSVQERVLEALDGRARSDREIHTEFNLTRYMPLETFRKFAAARRKERAARREDAVAASPECSSSAPCPDSAPLDTAIAGCIEAITDSLSAGRVGKLNAAAALQALVKLAELRQVRLPELAMTREEHEAKMADYRAAQQRKLDELEGNTPGLTPEIKAKIKREVLGL